MFRVVVEGDAQHFAWHINVLVKSIVGAEVVLDLDPSTRGAEKFKFIPAKIQILTWRRAPLRLSFLFKIKFILAEI